MKYWLFGALLVTASVSAQLMSQEEAQKELPNKCKEGCITLSKKEIEELNTVIQANIQQAGMNGYRQGVQDGLQEAKGNPKVCPKNI